MLEMIPGTSAEGFNLLTEARLMTSCFVFVHDALGDHFVN